ncbi:UNVERIFIED_CONTAM: hypothetical protein K2H54_058041 [Gekko kuhli]
MQSGQPVERLWLLHLGCILPDGRFLTVPTTGPSPGGVVRWRPNPQHVSFNASPIACSGVQLLPGLGRKPSRTGIAFVDLRIPRLGSGYGWVSEESLKRKPRWSNGLDRLSRDERLSAGRLSG